MICKYFKFKETKNKLFKKSYPLITLLLRFRPCVVTNWQNNHPHISFHYVTTQGRDLNKSVMKGN